MSDKIALEQWRDRLKEANLNVRGALQQLRLVEDELGRIEYFFNRMLMTLRDDIPTGSEENDRNT